VNVMCGSVDAALGANAWSYGVTSGHNVCDTPQFSPELRCITNVVSYGVTSGHNVNQTIRLTHIKVRSNK
jgi:hypothetical protein